MSVDFEDLLLPFALATGFAVDLPFLEGQSLFSRQLSENWKEWMYNYSSLIILKNNRINDYYILYKQVQ